MRLSHSRLTGNGRYGDTGMTDGSIKAAWEHFPHEADVGIRGLGPTKECAFEQAALALTAVITDPHKVEPLQEVQITCEAIDDELLFIDW